MAMGQHPVPPVNIPTPTKIGSEMGGEFTYQNGIPKNGFAPQRLMLSDQKWPPPQSTVAPQGVHQKAFQQLASRSEL